jgi:hypothetical protein
MPACGHRFRKLLVTRDGNTPEKPWGWGFAGPDNYDEWYDVVHRVGEAVFLRWNYLLDVEKNLAGKPVDPEGPQGPFPGRDQVLFLLLDFAKRLEDVPHVVLEPFDVSWGKPFGNLTYQQSVREEVDLAEAGICLLERLDDAVQYYEQPPLPSPHEPAEGMEELEGDDDADDDASPGIGSAFVTVLGVVGGWLLWKKRKVRKT